MVAPFLLWLISTGKTSSTELKKAFMLDDFAFDQQSSASNSFFFLKTSGMWPQDTRKKVCAPAVFCLQPSSYRSWFLNRRSQVCGWLHQQTQQFFLVIEYTRFHMLCHDLDFSFSRLIWVLLEKGKAMNRRVSYDRWLQTWLVPCSGSHHHVVTRSL